MMTPELTALAFAGLLQALQFTLFAYAFGWRPWRSAIWSVGFFATLTMIVAALI